MTRITLTATHSSGAVATRRTDRDYTFAAVTAQGTATFHSSLFQAEASASLNGGEVVRVALKGKAPKATMTAAQAIDTLTRHGFVPQNHQGVAGGDLWGFVKGDVIADLFVGREGELKGEVLLISKMGSRRVTTGTDQLVELEALLAAG